MATYSGQNATDISDVDLLLHPELLSEDFMQLILREKSVKTNGRENRDHLTEIYLRHAIPLPQRSLPNNRWGKRVNKKRECNTSVGNRLDSNDHSRKRPLIVFDGSSSHSGPVKLKKPGGTNMTTGVTDRLKPPPAANLSNPIRRLSGSTTSSSSPTQCSNNTNLKREASSTDATQSAEVKKKIQHVTWP
ncbi:ashwin [Takifugu rubripes]|uniref:ashwin n=1 Tax=Takifugu rubripes TaxID=31033 RepID=UPI0002988F8F|nr:ashwin [Takifugu rubripes]|eukprot:XP_003961841.1 PREDICTED: ashwin [Takifugu rubripes]